VRFAAGEHAHDPGAPDEPRGAAPRPLGGDRDPPVVRDQQRELAVGRRRGGDGRVGGIEPSS